MVYFFGILLLAALYTGKMIVQSLFCRQKLTSLPMLLAFNCVMFLTSAALITCLILAEGNTISPTTMLYGGAFGLVSVLYQIVYTYSLRLGSSSLTVLIVNFSCIVPLAFGLFLWNEPLTPLLAAGVVLTVISLLLSRSPKEDEQKGSGRWVIMVALCFLANSLSLLLQKFFQFTDFAFERNGYLLVSNLVGACGSAILCVFLSRKKDAVPIKWDKVLLLSAMGCGALICMYHPLALLLAGKMNASVYYPVLNGVTMIQCTAAGILILHERLTKRAALSILVGIAAIVLLSI